MVSPREGLHRLYLAATVLAVLSAVLVTPLVPGPASAADYVQDGDAQPPFEIVHEVGGLVTALAAEGDKVYVGIGSKLVILNADTPSGVPEGGELGVRLPHTIKDTAVLNPGLVAVLAGDLVFLVDVADPHRVDVVATYDQGEPLRALEAHDGIVYLLGDQAVHVVDASVPAMAHAVAGIDLPSRARRHTQIAAGDRVLFVGGGIGSVLAYEMSRPDSPLLLGGYEDNLADSHMAVSGRTLYASHDPDLFDDDGTRLVTTIVYVMEVNDDNELVKHGFVTLEPPMPVPPDFFFVDIAAAAGHVYLGGSTDWADYHYLHKAVRCWDLTDPKNPIEGPTVTTDGLGSPVTMTATEDAVFLGADDARLAEEGFQSPAIGVADIGEPMEMSWLGYWRLDDLGGVDRVAASATDVVVEEYAGRTHVYEGRYTAGHRPSGYLREPRRMIPLEYSLVQDRLYTLSVGDLVLFDIADRSLPTVRATAAVTTRMPALAVAEPLILAASGSAQSQAGEPGPWLMIYEHSPGDRSELRLVGEVPVSDYLVQSIAVAGTYAYVVAKDSRSTSERIALFDIADPTLPRFLFNVDIPDDVRPKSLVVRGDRAYVAVRSPREDVGNIFSGLVVLDVSVPRRTRILGSARTPTVEEGLVQPTDRACQLALSGHYVMYACHEPTVHVIDVGNPVIPTGAQSIEFPEMVTDLDAAAGQAYVVLKNKAMIVLRETADEPEPGTSRAIYVPLALTHARSAR